jgi:hypothetical protein
MVSRELEFEGGGVRAGLVFIGLFSATAFAVGQSVTHSNGFQGKTPFWKKGDANVRVTELDHAIGTRYVHNGLTAEMIKIDAQPQGQVTQNEFAYYTYAVPKAPISSQLSARVYVKAFRTGIQLRARIVLPRHRDPAQPNAPMTAVLVGDSYDSVNKWQALAIGDPAEGLKKLRPILTSELKQDVNFTDAYIDQLILNVYPGPGITEVWIDDLEIGPCESSSLPAATTVSNVKEPAAVEPVEFRNGQFRVAGKPFFIKAIRLTDTDPYVLANCQFNTVWLPDNARPEQIDDVVRHGFRIVPTLPIPSGQATTASINSDADAISASLAKYRHRDSILMWNLGSGRTSADAERIGRAVSQLAQFDPKRARSADLWDGYASYDKTLNAIGTHRWPLFTSLELGAYRDWLRQRKAIAGSDKLFLTWVQTHLPDWYVSLAGLSADAREIDAPIGPHPEQLRLLTYLSIASGCRGIGFWSDRYLSDSHHGRDRLLELCLLNAELKLIEPILADDHGQTSWIDTNDPNIKAAVIATPRQTLVIPIWLGAGTQYCPDLGARGNLKIRVPGVNESAEPWLLNPCDVVNLKTHGQTRSVPGGTEVTIPEFDLTALIVFTSDTSKTLVDWQDDIRHITGDRSARWAVTLAAVEFNKTLQLHERLQRVAPPVRGANDLLKESERLYRAAEKYLDNGQANMAYREARRALRPLRMLLRDYWTMAVATLDTPTASPYAISAFTLPKHWDLAAKLQTAKPGPNVLPHGTFDLKGEAPPQGAAIASLPGWTKSVEASDPVIPTAALINSSMWKGDKGPSDLGTHVLELSMKPAKTKDAQGKAIPAPGALERAYVAVDSPPVSLPPGTIVRITFRANIPESITAGVDGAMVYDDAGGEPLAVRLQKTNGWKTYHLYRIVPASGSIAVRFALTGIGTAVFDGVTIEAMKPPTASP